MKVNAGARGGLYEEEFFRAVREVNASRPPLGNSGSRRGGPMAHETAIPPR